jgi:hypothetical protein
MQQSNPIEGSGAASNQKSVVDNTRMEFSFRLRSPTGATAEIDGFKGSKDQFDAFQRGFPGIASEMNRSIGAATHINGRMEPLEAVDLRQLEMNQFPDYRRPALPPQSNGNPIEAASFPVFNSPILLPPGSDPKAASINPNAPRPFNTSSPSLEDAVTVFQRSPANFKKAMPDFKKSLQWIEILAWSAIVIFVVYSFGSRLTPWVTATFLKSQPKAQVQQPQAQPSPNIKPKK